MVVETVTPDVTAESSINDILGKSPDAQAEKEATPSEPSPETEPQEGAEETPAEGEKPETEAPEGEAVEDGKPIPYQRFKQVNEERKQFKTELDELREAQGKFDALLQDPEVLKVIRKKQGFTDEAIESELKESGITPEPKPGQFDLSTEKGWRDLIRNEIQQALFPVQKTLTETQRMEQTRQMNARFETEKVEASKICKEVYGIEYGDEKNPTDSTTGAGKIFAYIEKHPEKSKMAGMGYLSKTDLLRLAIAEEGVKLGEKKGEAKVKERQAKLKAAAMEGEVGTQTEDYPQPDWPSHKIIEWKEKHPNASI